MNAPTVTVFIAVHNRARYIGPAIESVLRQSFADFEVLVVDDGSTDNSVEVVESYTDPRIRLVRNEQNLGIPLTRSRGLQLARGRYFAILDSDDIAPRRRLERQVAFLDRNPLVATVGGWAREMTETGKLRGGLKPLPVRPGELHARLLFRTCHHHSSVMGRTAVLREYDYRPEFPVAEDSDMFSRIAERHQLANLPRVLLHRRVHTNRITRERAELVRSRNLAILARQLDTLGMSYSAAELQLHFELARLKKEGIAPDHAYLDQSAQWFVRLIEANRASGTYAPKALVSVILQLWAIACVRAIPNIGMIAATRAFLAFSRARSARAVAQQS